MTRITSPEYLANTTLVLDGVTYQRGDRIQTQSHKENDIISLIRDSTISRVPFAEDETANKLAAYEDTGLSPAEVIALAAKCRMLEERVKDLKSELSWQRTGGESGH